ncbi:MAG: hypothetical protein J7J76_05115 [Candidatus Latescibacteria bacterium]|nr:hypothetical protein [Candidatus Latescibacterota bacterium]
MQINDPDRRAIPGFSFEDCIPLTGDELYPRPRWKQREDASKLIGEHVRLEFKLFQAELYAVRWDLQPWYGDLPIERIWADFPDLHEQFYGCSVRLCSSAGLR